MSGNGKTAPITAVAKKEKRNPPDVFSSIKPCKRKGSEKSEWSPKTVQTSKKGRVIGAKKKSKHRARATSKTAIPGRMY